MFERIAFIGAGRLARTLAPAWAAAGQRVVAVASRQHSAAQNLTLQLPGCQALSPEAAVSAADLVLLTVSDDAIATLASALPWRAGQAVVHCSGATELSALAPAERAGAAVGGFHPLQIFSDPARAARLLAGSTVCIEAMDAGLSERLHGLAAALGMTPMHLRPGTRAAYHAAANLAASSLLAVLAEAQQVWAAIGLSAEAALPALLPLARGTLDAAEARGLAGALSGPVARGDAGVLRAHLQALDGLGAAHGHFYRELLSRQIELAAQAGRQPEALLAELRRLLAD
ncbi:DUF2520 domain-containing protein [Paucibacter sp. DJ1R-11]|uniref:Rossmann-like and DUF2520 domain-containing protein n=1 Tax=Paucibacter sp. DJ1R-11 TaxID=2893556 RepID=UPI0021E3D727|nr:DUF2520 domain-containing protein [Paucibacter sp. DJ1R-11]MCV2361865.1 DUF2520 domain-containing protein [Paucibacter sp. DJ1R-11]